MKHLLTVFAVLLFSVTVCGQSYTARVLGSANSPLPFVKFSHKGKVYNSDSLGSISGTAKIGDTLTFNDFNYENKVHVIKAQQENIYLTERYRELTAVPISQENTLTELQVKRSKNAVFFSMRHDMEDAYLLSNQAKLVFNNIEIPIKYFSYEGYTYNENATFSLQLFSVEKGIPKDPLTERIYFTASRKQKIIHISLKEKQVIPGEDFFVVLKAYEINSVIRDRQSFRFNPYFLCNTDGIEGSYLQYRQKEGFWRRLDRKELNGNIFNLNIRFYLK